MMEPGGERRESGPGILPDPWKSVETTAFGVLPDARAQGVQGTRCFQTRFDGGKFRLFGSIRLASSGEDNLSDSVAVDAKRILLRYGAPIAIMDEIGEKQRIEFARLVSRTPVPDRGERLLDILVEHGYLDPEVAEETAKKYRKAKKRSRR